MVCLISFSALDYYIRSNTMLLGDETWILRMPRGYDKAKL